MALTVYKNEKRIQEPFVSIIMLTHNAKAYVKHSIESLRNTDSAVKYELIVLDNASNRSTRIALEKLLKKNYIDQLLLSDENTLFSKGNNIASRYASNSSRYLLLLNSDIEIRNRKWLSALLNIHRKGVTALGLSDRENNRPDGFCYLVDKELFEKDFLNEHYAWFFSLARLTASILNDGYHVNTIEKYENLLYHYGGKSGRVSSASGMDTSMEEISRWFNGYNCNYIEKLELNKNDICYNPSFWLNKKAAWKLVIKPYRKRLKKFLIRHHLYEFLKKGIH